MYREMKIYCEEMPTVWIILLNKTTANAVICIFLNWQYNGGNY